MRSVLLAGFIVGVASMSGDLTAKPREVVLLDTAADWQQHSGTGDGALVMGSENIGGKFDLMGNGALLLEKKDRSKSFWKSNDFQNSGQWTHAMNRSEPE